MWTKGSPVNSSKNRIRLVHRARAARLALAGGAGARSVGQRPTPDHWGELSKQCARLNVGGEVRAWLKGFGETVRCRCGVAYRSTCTGFGIPCTTGQPPRISGPRFSGRRSVGDGLDAIGRTKRSRAAVRTDVEAGLDVAGEAAMTPRQVIATPVGHRRR